MVLSLTFKKKKKIATRFPKQYLNFSESFLIYFIEI